jgi:hypothetical protein
MAMNIMTTFKRTLIYKISTILTLLVFTPDGWGQTTDSEIKNALNKINVFEAEVIFPLAHWIKPGKSVADQFETHKKQSGPSFTFELIPKGHTFDDWKEIYAVSGAYIDKQPNPNVPFENIANAAIQPYFQMCGKDNIGFKRLEKTNNIFTFILLCESAPNPPAHLSKYYGADVGQITVMKIFRVKDTIVRVYHEWRGPRFSRDNSAEWPAPGNTVLNVVRYFSRVQAYPIQKN